jgi:tetraacyldisaccharide 4'-kinase
VKAALHAGVRRWWAGGGGTAGGILSAAAAPAEWLFRAAVARRNRRYDVRGGTHVDGLWVVSVGNLAVGGTGKTPIAAWAARRLVEAGLSTALLARGYGEDELLLHGSWNPEVRVVANADRVAAARAAVAGGAGAAVLDDGFQHRALARDVDVVLVAVEDGYPRRMLPRGPFREPPSALARAHGVVVTRRTAGSEQAQALASRIGSEHPHLLVGVVSLLPGGWRDLEGAPAAAPPSPVLAVAAVARPEAFAHQVEGELAGPVELCAFPDHHAYGEADARTLRERAGGRTIVVTEKDAVKLRRFMALLGPVRVMVQALGWEAGEAPMSDLVTSVAAREA